MKFSAAILAGGESRRMGEDKAWLRFDGETLLGRAIATVRRAGVSEIFISGRPGVDYSQFGCPVLLDVEAGFGPVAGIERALRAAQCPLVLVLAVDMPLITVELLNKLCSRCAPLVGVVPKIHGDLEPLAAVYPKRAHVIAMQSVAHFRRAARDFAEACLRQRAVKTLRILDTETSYFQNCNAPADLHRTYGPAR